MSARAITPARAKEQMMIPGRKYKKAGSCVKCHWGRAWIYSDLCDACSGLERCLEQINGVAPSTGSDGQGER